MAKAQRFSTINVLAILILHSPFGTFVNDMEISWLPHDELGHKDKSEARSDHYPNA